MSSLLNVFDERAGEFDERKRTDYNYVDTFWTALTGSGFRKITETYETMLRRPDLFEGKTALNLFYAVYVGNTYNRDSLYTMFKNYLDRSPSVKNTNVIFNWARMIRERQMNLNYEPVLAKLNTVFNTWMNSGQYVNFNGNRHPLNVFKPVFYNSEGESQYELVPYIAYLFTFLIYGYPFQFGDTYSESSMKSYFASLEDWFDICYSALYKEQGITTLNANDVEIPDQTWKGFFNAMLDEEKLIDIRNSEMNKSDDLLSAQTSTQLSIQDADLANKFGEVLVQLIKFGIAQATWEKIILQFEPFLNSFMDSAELMQMTEWILCGSTSEYAIDSHDSFRYLRTSEKLPDVFDRKTIVLPQTIPIIDSQIFKLDADLSSIAPKIAFSKGNFVMQAFSGYLRDRLQSRRTEISEMNAIYITPSDLEARDLYPFILNFFCNGLWRTQSEEVIRFMSLISVNSSFVDFFGIRNVCEIVHGNTIGSILAPIYAISLFDLWAYTHLSNDRSISDFNMFKYLRWSVNTFDGERIKKLTSILYSCLFLNNQKYREFVHDEAVRFIELTQSAYAFLQPFVQVLDDDASKWALVGMDGYRYAKFQNPILRGYGFCSNAFGVNERSYLIYRMTELIANETLFSMIEMNLNNQLVLDETMRMGINQLEAEKLPRLLTRFSISETGTYYQKSVSEILAECKNETLKLLIYCFRRSSPSLMLDYEEIRIKDMTSPEKKAYVNGYAYGSRFINVCLARDGKSYLLPRYGIAGEVRETITTTTIPDGLRVLPIYTISAVNPEIENSVYWILTKMPAPSQFDAFAKMSEFMPDDGSYGLTDRIQGYPKI